MRASDLIRTIRVFALSAVLALGPALASADPPAPAASAPAPPAPRLGGGQAVDWWFAYKFNASSFPSSIVLQQTCRFGGQVQHKAFSQHYAVASNLSPVLTAGAADDLGESPADPLGATFDEVWTSSLNFVVWNDQLYDHPKVKGDGSWGHSKGMLAWNDAGEGFILQVTTPSWPGSASAGFPRLGSGNTLGCIAQPNNLSNAQHFFALKLTHEDLLKVLEGLKVASVITGDPALGDLPAADASAREAHQLIRNGGPADVRAAVDHLGKRDHGAAIFMASLSSGFKLIAKPSDLNAPPWQLVSAVLGVPLRTATWWAAPRIASAHAGAPGCWAEGLGEPMEVQVATTGHWEGKAISLIGGANHAKLGVSLDAAHPWVIFGDMNQQGTLVPKAKGKTGKTACDSSQNGRGGLFFALESAPLNAGLRALMDGDTAPYAEP